MRSIIKSAFPSHLQEDVKTVAAYLSQELSEGIRHGISEQYIEMRLLNGEVIRFPYRFYFKDEHVTFPTEFTKEQRCIYHCIYTRHYNGYIREKHMTSLLLEYPDELPDWVCSYLLSLSGEYIMEILERLYEMLSPRKNETIQAMSQMNSQQFLYIHDRMISYWNEFYRGRCPRYKQYIGKKLFEVCYGYTRRMEKQRMFVVEA
ncbi:hypothetical protein [uncultured Enterococcus sp.]|uniref:hypothetical protein n=1 Tax=uncultured Enterococcus sp. TaxID=167972 RepID=UPI002AA85CD4|nr:hypothetical protein [uncultured Enterococcus sp.]